MPAAEQFLWFNRTMNTCGKWMGGIVGRQTCFPIRLLEIILISSSEGARHTWYIVDPHLRNVTFFVTWWSREIYQLCINLLTTTDFAMSRQIAVGENWPSMCTETHIFKQTNCYSKILKRSGLSAGSMKSKQMMRTVSRGSFCSGLKSLFRCTDMAFITYLFMSWMQTCKASLTLFKRLRTLRMWNYFLYFFKSKLECTAITEKLGMDIPDLKWVIISSFTKALRSLSVLKQMI